MHHQADLLGHVQKLVQVHTSVGELPEGTLLLDLGIRLKETSPPGQREANAASMYPRLRYTNFRLHYFEPYSTEQKLWLSI